MNILFMLVIIYLLVRDTDFLSQKIISKPVLSQLIDETTENESVVVSAVEVAAHIPKAQKDEENSNVTSGEIERAQNFVNDSNDYKPIINETKEPEEPDSINSVNVYYDGKLVRMEETDSEGNQLITISKSLDDIGELSSSDASYVQALDELKQGIRSQVTLRKPNIKEATSHQAKEVSEEQSIDYFNKVDVSKNDSQLVTGELTLADQIAKIVSEPEITPVTENNPTVESEDSYIQILKTESVERANEMRTIQVMKGDTLWEIAERAYGSGDEYPRIFDANPHLTDPDKIEIGDILRVPLST